jgi:hypothetical protein
MTWPDALCCGMDGALKKPGAPAPVLCLQSTVQRIHQRIHEGDA